jgi:putative ABC transport system ATP-binding protein
MSSVIEIKNLYKSYHTGVGDVPVLMDVNLEVSSGEFVAIMGPSGSGKSTFMNILGCLDSPSSGEYFLNESNVKKLDKDELAELRNSVIGFVFQGFNLLSRNTLIENVALPLVYSRTDKPTRVKKAKEMLKNVGLEAFGDYMPNQISGGQQQRVAIARALVNSPKLILADEPTGNLDTKTSREIMELFSSLNRDFGITIVLITHEPDIAMYSNRLVKFKDGKVQSDTPTSEASFHD